MYISSHVIPATSFIYCMPLLMGISSAVVALTNSTGGLFHCYMLNESICHFRGVGVYFHFYSIFHRKLC